MPVRPAAVALTVFVLFAPALAQGPPQVDGIARLLGALEGVLVSGQPERYMELLSEGADRTRARAFADHMVVEGSTRAVVRERNRTPITGTLPGQAYALVLEVFVESGNRGWLSTWRLDVRRKSPAGSVADDWVISGQDLLSTLPGLYRLALDEARQFEARDLVVRSEDLELRLPRGTVFLAEASAGPTALVLLGDGQMSFRPRPETERGQLRIFGGHETLETAFKAAFVRLNPVTLEQHLDRASLVHRPVAPAELAQARAIFNEQVGKSFTLNLTDLSPDTWSLVPQPGDFLAEIETRRFRTLTYALSGGEAEDVTLFDRRSVRNISLYASQRRAASVGRAYNEDDLADYDVQHYDIQARLMPERRRIEGRTIMTMVIRSSALTSLTFRLAESLTVKSVVGEDFGRLLAVPVRNQNSVVVTLPGALTRGTTFRMIVNYEGRLDPQTLDGEAIDLRQDPQEREVEPIPIESSYLYSNRSYWHPQAVVTDYATARIQVTVPPGFGCVASGEAVSVDSVPDPAGGPKPLTTYVYVAGQPARYLSLLVSRFVEIGSTTIRSSARESDNGTDGSKTLRPGVAEPGVGLSVLANPRQQGSSRQVARRAADIMEFYSSLVGHWPYSSLTVGVIERELPGGHSPPYLTVLAQPVLGSRYDWRRDPSSFDDYPEFFLAHELAHQWWGQAVGWKNYHEQWLSEGLSQYFAALYAEESRGAGVFAGIVRRLHDTAMAKSDQGPIALGYRVGHIKRDSRVFRAVIYNKSAAVLHMLRRLIGDEAFFSGIRRFFETWRFKKAGTLDLRRAFESTSGMPLERFFERWIHEARLPEVKFSSRTENGASGPELVVRFEQQGPVFDFPVTVSIEHTDRRTRDVIVAVTDQVVEQRIPLTGTVRRVQVNGDKAALVKF